MSLSPSPSSNGPFTLFYPYLSGKDNDEAEGGSSSSSSGREERRTAEAEEDVKESPTDGTQRNGAVHGAQPQQQLDFSALAMQLLQQSMFGGSGGGTQPMMTQQRENGKLLLPPAPPHAMLPASNGLIPSPVLLSSCPFSPSPTMPSSAPSKPSKCSSRLPFAGNRRSVAAGNSKCNSLISAATTAALMAPSPLGALPAIPGALAVAASPAAQLFNDDDWSWHRNPAAAIRSGGTNKQTPVWKYFVYNKTENLSRCIVGTCTYQLKGPHTSTLACHLKKHVAEYAEFQRLKTEYTRERAIANTNGTISGGDRSSSSSCSTPLGAFGQNFQHGTSKSPEARQHLLLSPGAAAMSCTPSPGPTTLLGGDKCIGGEQVPAELLNNPHFLHIRQHQHQPFLAGIPQNGGIFAPAHPQHPLHPTPSAGHPFFNNFLMAAATMASSGAHCPPPLALLRPDCLGQLIAPSPIDPMVSNGFSSNHQNDQPNRRRTEKRNSKSPIGGGTGANLQDILDVLSKRAAAAAAEREQKEEEAVEEAEEIGKTQMGKRKKRSAGKRKREWEEEEEREEGRKRTREGSEDGKGEEEGMEEGRKRTREGSEDGKGEQEGMEEGRKRTREGSEDGKGEQEERTQTHLLLHHPSTFAPHSVAHLLKEESDQEDQLRQMTAEADRDEIKRVEDEGEEEGQKIGTGPEHHLLLEEFNKFSTTDHQFSELKMSQLDLLALSLGTSFPRAVLCRLFELNSFFRLYRAEGIRQLTVERVDELLDTQFAVTKRQIRAMFSSAKAPQWALMVDVCCANCWRRPNGIEENDAVPADRPDACRCSASSDQLLCTLSAAFESVADNSSVSSPILLLAVRTIEAENEMETLIEEVLSEFGCPSPAFVLSSLSRAADISSIPFLSPISLAQCLRNCAQHVLGTNEKVRRMANDIWAMFLDIEKVPPKALSTFPNDLLSDHFFNCAKSVMENRAKCVDGLSEEQRESLRQFIGFVALIREKVRIGNKMTLGNCDERMEEDIVSALKTANFPALGDLPELIVSNFSTKIGPEIDRLNAFIRRQNRPSMDLLMRSTPCSPVELRTVLRISEAEWQSEGTERTERSAVVLFNCNRRYLTK